MPIYTVVLGYDVKTSASLLQRASILTNLIQYDEAQGRYTSAEKKGGEVVPIRKDLLGHEHPETLASMNHLARVLCIQGRYVKAEQMH